ncbi:MAG: OmpA family protein [Acidobacteriia bacterium]|nr:OmpA family protein [Terriglobia bacterium]
MKKNRAPHHENHERWLVSYADFITLLFAFFVVMFATAQKDKSKIKDVSVAVRDAIEHGQLTAAITGILNHTRTPPQGKGDTRQKAPPPDAPGTPGQFLPKLDLPPTPPPKTPAATQADLLKSLGKLEQGLDVELKTGKVMLKLDRRGLVISLREAAFFASGDDAISGSGYRIIEKIAQVVATLPNPLRLEGHTDWVPIHNSRFKSNWELSVARSIAMLELLNQRYHFPTGRMSVAGFAENAPADTNETEEGRAHNRRVDVVVLSAEALTGEPPTLKP